MATFRCAVCNKDHELSELAIALQRPHHYFQVPEAERATRIKMNGDLCTIDNKQFLIRGVMEIPVKDTTGKFEWGLWALVNKRDFQHYLDLWDAKIDPDEMPMQGVLSGNPPGYPEANLTELAIYLRSGGMRPLFKAVDPKQPLAIDQRDGITLEKIYPLIERLHRRG